MLNEAQIEQAARKLCELRGIDPELCREWNPEWVHVAEEIRAAEQVREAIASVEAESHHELFGFSVHDAPPFCPPPGWCACEHSFAAHSIKGSVHGQEMRGCAHCGCFDYVPV